MLAGDDSCIWSCLWVERPRRNCGYERTESRGRGRFHLLSHRSIQLIILQAIFAFDGFDSPISHCHQTCRNHRLPNPQMEPRLTTEHTAKSENDSEECCPSVHFGSILADNVRRIRLVDECLVL